MSDLSKSVFSYKAIVWDLDGTLYYQRRMRLIMLKELIVFYLFHPLRIKELLAVQKFRRVREKWNSSSESADLESEQYACTARLLKLPFETVKNAVETWIYKKPLKFIASCRDEKAAELFGILKKKHIGCYIFSDYPILEKLNALNLSADGYYAATDERLGVLKPDPKGLRLIMEDTGLKPSEILMIGDRDSRDAEAARRAGCDYIILSGSENKRKKQYAGIIK